MLDTFRGFETPRLRQRTHDKGVDLECESRDGREKLCIQSKYTIRTIDDLDGIVSKFKDYQDNGRGLCTIFDQVYRKHHALTQDCLSSLPSETEEFEAEEDRIYCTYKQGDRVKLIDSHKHHTEWESFIVVGQKHNYNRFRSDESYLNEPNWYIYIASTKQPVPVPFWVAETEICHSDHSAFIETEEVF